jgi:hypothetical protein
VQLYHSPCEVPHPSLCLLQGPKTVRRYVQECRDLHFDAVELPDACADTLPEKDYLLLLDDLQEVTGCLPSSKPCSRCGVHDMGT